jgi:O-antigen ligase
MQNDIKILETDSRFSKVLYFLMVSPVIFLLVNRYPYMLVGAVLISIIIGLLFFFKRKAITTFHLELTGILLIIYTYLILSYLFAGQRFVDIFSYDFLRNDGNFFFCYILFFVFAIPHNNFRKLADYYFKIFFIVFTIFAIFGIIEYFFEVKFLMVQSSGHAGRFFLALNNAHNATGSVYAIVCVFLLVFLLKENKNILRLLYIVSLVISLLALFLTKSRASYIGFIAAAVIILWLHFKSVKKFFISIAVLIAAAIPLVFLTDIYKRIFQILDLRSGTTVVRFFIWEKAWHLFSQSPLFGIGYGRFNDIFNIDTGVYDLNRLKGFWGIIALYLKDKFVFSDAHAHNAYLHFLAETGIIGLFLIMLFWILCVIKIIQAYRDNSDSFSSKVLLSAIGGIFALLILSFFENYISATTIMIPLSMISSIALGLHWENLNFRI